MTVSAETLSTLFLIWFLLAVAVTLLSAWAARRKIDSPWLVTLCTALLGLFPPFNLLVLAALAMLPDRPTAPRAST